MRYRLQLLKLDMRAAPLMFLLSLLAVYLLFLLALFNGAPEDFADNYRGITQMALPLLYLLWPAGHLIQWYDHKGAEAMRACFRRGYCAGPELCGLYLLFVILVLPQYLAASLIQSSLLWELPRTLLQLFIFQSLMYTVTVLLKSITMGLMVSAAYILFSVVICREPAFMKYSLLNPYAEAFEEYQLGKLAMLFLGAMIVFHLTMCWERRNGNGIEVKEGSK